MRTLKIPQIPVVMGGMHASVIPKEGLQHADAVVVGEADEVWPQVIADAESGRCRLSTIPVEVLVGVPELGKTIH